ncbi:GNAT family N-acetyltransferase [Paenarthrobacter sp. NPDC058040]|uniref:GNAT family N-acetyltransferase n=1 Tax=unclassified Paenarthrobacter TaxID=2634190 RepID=UPI0036DDD22E
MTDTYFLSAEAERIDRGRVLRWLSEESYRAQGRVREKQEAAIDASRNYGVYETSTGAQVAYGRVVTDSATFAWLCDVFVAAEVRGRGIGKMLAAGVVADLEPLGLKRVLLSTGDAHGLYAQLGFTELTEASKMMALTR